MQNKHYSPTLKKIKLAAAKPHGQRITTDGAVKQPPSAVFSLQPILKANVSLATDVPKSLFHADFSDLQVHNI